MRNVWTIAKREFNLYFVSPVAYLVIFAFLLLLGIILSFFMGLSQSMQGMGGGTAYSPADIINTFFTPLLLIAGCSALTMRLMAEEQRAGTLELLLTAPVREWEVILGKWLAALGLMTGLWLITLIYAVILNAYTSPGIDWQALIPVYTGLLLMTGAMLAVGVFASTLFGNQIAAFFVSLILLSGLWLEGFLFRNPADPFTKFMDYLGLVRHYYDNLSSGVLDLVDITYFVSVIALFLFLAVRMVESRRWR